MKNNIYVAIVLLTAFSISFVSCKKKDVDGNQDTGKSGITMKVDGVSWSSTINTLFAEPLEHAEIGAYYYVLVGGQRIDSDETEDDVSAVNLYVIIPASRFENPKGVYPILSESVARPNEAIANFTDARPGGHVWYASYHPGSPTQSVGSVEITDFEIGMQTAVGYSTGVEGYTRLVGKFHMNLYGIQTDPAPELKITEGRFDLRSGIGFDF